MDLVFGYMQAQMIHAAAETGVADALSSRPFPVARTPTC